MKRTEYNNIYQDHHINQDTVTVADKNNSDLHMIPDHNNHNPQDNKYHNNRLNRYHNKMIGRVLRQDVIQSSKDVIVGVIKKEVVMEGEVMVVKIGIIGIVD